MSILADVIIVAVILLAVFIGAKSGLLQSLAGVIVLVCSAVGASFAAKFLADPLSEVLHPFLADGLTEKLRGFTVQTGSAGELLEKFGFSGETLQRLTDQVTARIRETGQSLTETVVGTVTHSVTYAVVFLVAFIILLVLLSLLVKGLELATKLPGLKTINSWGGGILGFIKGVLLVFAAVWVLRRLQLVITPEMVEGSTLLKFFAEHSPLSLLTGL